MIFNMIRTAITIALTVDVLIWLIVFGTITLNSYAPYPDDLLDGGTLAMVRFVLWYFLDGLYELLEKKD